MTASRQTLLAMNLELVFAFCVTHCVSADQGNDSQMEIRLTHDAENSQAPDFDPDGRKLTSIMEAAACFWEEVFHKARIRFNIDFSWAPPELNELATTSKPSSRSTSASIQFQNAGAWFVDESPFDHSEFRMRRSLVRDNSRQVYSGEPPDFMEATFYGEAPFPEDSIFVDIHDLMSVALHEVAHAIGMYGGLRSLDVPPKFVGGLQDIRIKTSVGDSSHLPNVRSNMSSNILDAGFIDRLWPSTTTFLRWRRLQTSITLVIGLTLICHGKPTSAISMAPEGLNIGHNL